MRRFRETIVTVVLAAGIASGDLVKSMHLGDELEKLVDRSLYHLVRPDHLTEIEDDYRKQLRIRDLYRPLPVLVD